MIWFKEVSTEQINKLCENTLVSHLEISITKLLSDSIEGVMQVKDTLKQPFGIVHGGANCVLAETLGSLAANLVCNPETYHAVGLSIQTNHIKAVRNGNIKGVARPVHIGRKTHIWEIDTFNDAMDLTSKTTLTMAIVQRK